MLLSQLHPNEGQIKGVPRNPRQITEKDFEDLKKSLRQFRKMLALRPMVVDEDFNILGGNMRYRALCRLRDEGVKIGAFQFTDEIPDEWVKQDCTMTEREKREFVTKDNVQKGEWDWDILANEWDSEELKEWGVDAANWDASDSADELESVEEDNFDEKKDEVQTICQKGDIWQLGNHRLMCGDSTDAASVALLMDGEKADLCITDPPYNVAIGSKNSFLKEFGIKGGVTTDIMNDKGMTDEEIGAKIWKPAFTNLRANAKDDCAIYVSMPQGGTHMMMMMMMHDSGWKVKHELMWLKSSPTFSLGRLNYDYQHEPIVYGWNKTHNWYATEPKRSILQFDKPHKSELHPTMKPIPLWAELINNSSKEGMNILDTFGGSGTTIIACEQLNRKCYMMELDPHYCDVIIARWEKLTGQKATKL